MTIGIDWTLLSSDAKVTLAKIAQPLSEGTPLSLIADDLGIPYHRARYRMKQLKNELARIEAGDPRTLRCVVCGELFGPSKHAQALTCSVKCRVAKHRAA